MQAIPVFVPPTVMQDLQDYVNAFFTSPRIHDIHVAYVRRGHGGAVLTVVTKDATSVEWLMTHDPKLKELRAYETFFGAVPGLGG